jgi:uncharacterized protein YuzE
MNISYLCVRALKDGEIVYRTIPIALGLMVDLDKNGKIIGVEKIGGQLNPSDMIDILQHAYFFGEYE